jgi:hypothetical protein
VGDDEVKNRVALGGTIFNVDFALATDGASLRESKTVSIPTDCDAGDYRYCIFARPLVGNPNALKRLIPNTTGGQVTANRQSGSARFYAPHYPRYQRHPRFSPAFQCRLKETKTILFPKTRLNFTQPNPVGFEARFQPSLRPGAFRAA